MKTKPDELTKAINVARESAALALSELDRLRGEDRIRAEAAIEALQTALKEIEAARA